METDMGGLISTADLAARLGDPNLRIFDSTTYLRPNPGGGFTVENGAKGYAERGHIPGAALIDLQNDLCDASSPLRFTMPSAADFARRAGAKGIGDGFDVVVYCDGDIWWSTRVWWMLRAAGFDRAFVLDGGLKKWIAEGRPLETTPRAHPPARLTPKPRDGLLVGKDAVIAALDGGDAIVVNCLRPEQHAGTSPVHYGRPGRIAGSVNVPAAALFAADNTFLPPDELAAKFAARGIVPGKRVVAYCGGGIAATGDAFALVALLGRDGVGVYDASLQEWAVDSTLPMATGEAA